LADNDWIVALSSVVVELPPSKWKDEHEEQFAQEIENLVSRFERVERLTFARRGSSATGFAMRVAVTNVNGTERDKVIFTQKGEEERIRRVQRKLESVLLKNGNVELAALATVFWNALGTNPTKD
jgi:nitrate/nitrite-specific signal transduction histidine kinase